MLIWTVPLNFKILDNILCSWILDLQLLGSLFRLKKNTYRVDKLSYSTKLIKDCFFWFSILLWFLILTIDLLSGVFRLDMKINLLKKNHLTIRIRTLRSWKNSNKLLLVFKFYDYQFKLLFHLRPISLVGNYQKSK